MTNQQVPVLSVELSGSKFDRMMDLVNDPKAKDISLESPSNLKHATLESKRNFFRRTHIVAKTVELYNKKVKNIEFLGLVGEEDAGKSTFIKVLLLAPILATYFSSFVSTICTENVKFVKVTKTHNFAALSKARSMKRNV